MADYATSIEVRAAPETVFDYLVTPDGLTSWMGTWARVDPVPDGRFEVDIAGSPVRGTFLEIDRPRRVVVSWGFAGDDALPPGSSRVAFTLHAHGSGTRVELVHSGLPDAALAGHREGWEHFVPRLLLRLDGRDPGADTWRPAS